METISETSSKHITNNVPETNSEPMKSNASELTAHVSRTRRSNSHIFDAKLACFMPGLAEFQNKWRLTVIEDSAGVHLYPQFLPVTGNTVSNLSYYIIYIFQENVERSFQQK